MTKEERNKLEKENAKLVKVELWLWFKLTIALLVLITLLLVYAPEIYRFCNGFSPIGKGVSIIVACLGVAFIVSKIK